MNNNNFIYKVSYKVFLTVFADTETRIVKEIYRTTSNQEAKTYMKIYEEFLDEQGRIEVLGTWYDREDCIVSIKRIEEPEELPF